MEHLIVVLSKVGTPGKVGPEIRLRNRSRRRSGLLMAHPLHLRKHPCFLEVVKVVYHLRDEETVRVFQPPGRGELNQNKRYCR